MADTWDVVVVGGGPPGENAAQSAIEGSARTAVIVEEDLLGGECSYWACMPSKALLRPLEALDAVRSLRGVYGGLDVVRVLDRRDDFTHHHDDSSQVDWAGSEGIDVVRGHGRLAGERTVEVTVAGGGRRTLAARHAVVLATGSEASIPPVAGLSEARPWTSRDVTNLGEIPRRVLVVGGGVVACEATTWLCGLGAEEVTVVEVGERLLQRNEPFAGEIVADHLRSRGVRVLTGTSLERVDRPGTADTGVGRIHGAPATVTLAGGEQVEVDEIVVAAGRSPRTADLGLDSVGLDLDRSHGYVPVDEHLTVPGVPGDWLYAVGDVNGRALLTHMGKYQARIAGAVIGARAEGWPLSGTSNLDMADEAAVPAVVFGDPQVASVGLTEARARQRGVDVVAVEYDLGAVAGAALARDGYQGRAKLVIDRGAGVVVGATLVGSDVAELLHSATIAVIAKVPLDLLWHAVPSYPTISEVWLRLLEAWRSAR